ncbi:hypothetical protein SDJN02_06389, partial [Cucurbita argyrosperma subsp. argyrosperma]
MKRKRFKRVTLRIGSVMEDEIGEEFERSGFTFDEEEEILKKYIQSPNPGFLEANQEKKKPVHNGGLPWG